METENQLENMLVRELMLQDIEEAIINMLLPKKDIAENKEDLLIKLRLIEDLILTLKVIISYKEVMVDMVDMVEELEAIEAEDITITKINIK